MERECLDKKHHLIRGSIIVPGKNQDFVYFPSITHSVILNVEYISIPVLLERESTIWDMEENHLQERHQLLKQQLKDLFFLQRHQLVKKHEKVGLRKIVAQPWF